jgi:hypothetical protein
MKKLISAVTVIALAALCLAAQEKDHAKTATAQIAGDWTLSMETPHGDVVGPMHLKQEGATATGSIETEHLGTLPITGTVSGNKVELTLEIADPQMKFKLTGAMDAKGMSGTTELGGAWKAARK